MPFKEINEWGKKGRIQIPLSELHNQNLLFLDIPGNSHADQNLRSTFESIVTAQEPCYTRPMRVYGAGVTLDHLEYTVLFLCHPQES